MVVNPYKCGGLSDKPIMPKGLDQSKQQHSLPGASHSLQGHTHVTDSAAAAEAGSKISVKRDQEGDRGQR